jgi:hypothetical protein
MLPIALAFLVLLATIRWIKWRNEVAFIKAQRTPGKVVNMTDYPRNLQKTCE